MASATYNAQTTRGAVTGTFRRPDGQSIYLTNDADIVVNQDRYMYGYSECGDAAPTSTQRDMARTIAHEVGHVLGQNHIYDKACATYEIAQPGVAFYGLCTTEQNAAKQIYGLWQP